MTDDLQQPVDANKKLIGGLAAALILIFTAGVIWFFGFSSSSPIGAGWFLFSFAAGLSMIVLPCTLPLAFVIVPLSMGKGIKKGLFIAGAFSLGIAITLSMYGVVAALIGEVAIGTLGAPLEVVKNWLYFIAGIATYLFALGELGLINVRMPTYSGAHPGFIQRQGDILKALLLGLFLGNVGVGCPHPATPLILTRIAASGDIFYGWLLFFTHAAGRVIPLMILAILGILGINALSWVISRKDKIERATGWAMVFVAGFILILGLFTHDWWVYSGSHSLLESVTQEEKFLGIIAGRLEVADTHRHGIADLEGHIGLFGLPLRLGNWALVFLWILPLFWYWRKHIDEQNSKYRFWIFALISFLLGFIFIYTIPHWFLKHKAPEEHQDAETEMAIAVDIAPLEILRANGPIKFEISVTDKSGAPLGETLEYSHERLFHVVSVSEDFKLFAHIHPEDQYVLTEDMFKKGEFPFYLHFPKEGRYLIAADFAHDGHDVAFTKTFDVGERKPVAILKDFYRAKKFDGAEVSLKTDKEIYFGEDTRLQYTFFADGKPVSDLEPYLSAPMHFSIISVDLAAFAHEHGVLSAEGGDNHHGWRIIPEVRAHGGEDGEKIDSRITAEGDLPAKFGPDVFLNYTFPHPGIYVIFGEAKRGGKVILTKFFIEVGARQGADTEISQESIPHGH